MRKRMRNGMWGMGRMREKLREDTGKRVGKTIWGEDEERNGEEDNLAKLLEIDEQRDVDRELDRLIYVREIKSFYPFKFSIYAWCIKIAIAGSLNCSCTFGLVAIFRSAKKIGLFMWRLILKNFMHDCSLMLWDHKFINASIFKLYLCGASNHQTS